ncbi:MAG: hypothetical protein U0T78_07825 [Cloacibacterium normanense]
MLKKKLQLKVELGEALEPLSKMRKLIAENMEKSWRSTSSRYDFYGRKCDEISRLS